MNEEFEVKLNMKVLKFAFKEFLDVTGPSGFATIFMLGYHYGKLVINDNIKKDNYSTSDVISFIKEWTNSRIKIRLRSNDIVIVCSKNPFTIGFICGCFSKISKDFKVYYKDDSTLIRLVLEKSEKATFF